MRRTNFFRKGFELATSTLVVMILGIMIIGGGLVLLKQIISAGTELGDDLPAKHRQELQSLMRDGQLVAAVPQHQEVTAGKETIAGLAVQNNLDEQTEFSITVTGFDENEEAINWRVRHFPTLTVEQNQERQAQLIIPVPDDAPAGTYTFVVEVTENNQLYDSKRFFTIRVR